jgi:hypothetical protein
MAKIICILTQLIGLIFIIINFLLLFGSMFVFDSPRAGGLLTYLFAMMPIICIIQTYYGMKNDNIILVLLVPLYYYITILLIDKFKNGTFEQVGYL